MQIKLIDYFEPAWELCLRTRDSSYKLIRQILASNYPFLTIIDRHGRFIGNLWPDKLNLFENELIQYQDIGDFLKACPEILEKNHYLSFEEVQNPLKLNHYKITYYPIIDRDQNYLGYINLKKVLYDKSILGTSQSTSTDRTILIVEDDGELREILQEWLETRSFKCITAKDGEEALIKIYDNPQIQIILTDLKMPNLNGKDLIRKIRVNDEKIPIIVLSGYGQKEDLIDFLRLGVNEFLDKPINMEALSEVLDKHIKNCIIEQRQIYYQKTEEMLGDIGIILTSYDNTFEQKMTSIVLYLSKQFKCKYGFLVKRNEKRWNTIASIPSNKEEFSTREKKENDLLSQLEKMNQTLALKAVHLELNQSKSSLIIPIVSEGNKESFIVCFKSGDDISFTEMDMTIANKLIVPLSHLIDYAKILQENLDQNKNLELKMKEMVDEMISLRKDAELQSKLSILGETAASIAHDIRNPLSVALGNINSIEHKAKLEVEILEKLNKVKSSITNINNITDSIYKMAHNCRDHQTFDLKESIDNILLILESKLSNNNVSITISSFTTTTLHGNQTQIEQVMTNLLSNAIDAVSSQEDKKVHIEVNSSNESSVEIAVMDNGPGIPQEKSEDVFKKWYTTKKIGEGSGLGLHICKSILNSHFSKLTYKRENDRTIFSFALDKSLS